MSSQVFVPVFLAPCGCHLGGPGEATGSTGSLGAAVEHWDNATDMGDVCMENHGNMVCTLSFHGKMVFFTRKEMEFDIQRCGVYHENDGFDPETLGFIMILLAITRQDDEFTNKSVLCKWENS